MSLFSMIDQVEDGHKKMSNIFERYNFKLEDGELNFIKYGPLGDRSYWYIPRVSKREQRLFKSLMTKQRQGVFTTYKGKTKWATPPGSTLKTPDSIILKYGKVEYAFTKDDSVKNLLSDCLRSLFNDYHQGQVTLRDSKQHDFRPLILALLDEIKSITARHAPTLSRNKILHLAYDIMALSFPQDFNSELNHEDSPDKDRYKAARIKSIIK